MTTSHLSELESAAELKCLLNENDVARVTRMSIASVRRWRLMKIGPPYKKLGAAVRYDPRELRRWLESLPNSGERAHERQ